MEKKIFYRVANNETKQGLWYNQEGEFTGLIHNEFDFCMNHELPMPYDKDIVGWLSSTDSLQDLFNWFSREDIRQLEEHGYYITTYEATKYRIHLNHFVIDQKTSKVKEIIPIEFVDSIIVI